MPSVNQQQKRKSKEGQQTFIKSFVPSFFTAVLQASYSPKRPCELNLWGANQPQQSQSLVGGRNLYSM